MRYLRTIRTRSVCGAERENSKINGMTTRWRYIHTYQTNSQGACPLNSSAASRLASPSVVSAARARHRTPGIAMHGLCYIAAELFLLLALLVLALFIKLRERREPESDVELGAAAA